ncbi:MAG: adenosine nucleotide hydrolase NudE [Microgenomates bacterium OLB23]|nr:MAG: adenosine nucleotide hydrolase NudE [Microgenomates bacterium OLB23]
MTANNQINMSNIPKFIKEEVVYKGRMFEVVHMTYDIDGQEVTHEKSRRAPGTRLIITKEEKVLLINEYRSELQDWDIRLPGGKVCDSLEEYHEFLSSNMNIEDKASEGAKKEALEEVGIVAKKPNFFSISTCGASVIWDLYYFVISEFEEHPNGQHLELGENIEVKWVTKEEAKKMALNGSIKEDRSAAVLLRFLNSVQKN